ncbi:hypothetical protein N0V82_002339 [Gnomoniopsis sp. IMI 355080]|nr:hypothetical protein N0V82_002339 [Gnomoniopsis sp. IMI 355080]
MYHSFITEHKIDLCCVPCRRRFGSKDDLERHKNPRRKHPIPTEGDALQCRGNIYTKIPSNSHAKVLRDLGSLCHTENTLLRHRFTLEAIPGFVQTPSPNRSSPKRKVIVLDCEMCGVEGGKSEVVSLMAIDFLTGEVLVDTLVKPSLPIIEWRSDIHGITPGKMAAARAAKLVLEGVEAARAELWRFLDGDTVLVGQSVNNDLDCLRIVHKTVVDTAVLASDAVFGADGTPRYWGLGLKDLCRELLDIKIREDSRFGSSTHDGLEDILAPREVVLWMLEHEEDFSVWANKRRQVSRKQHFAKRKGKKQKARRSTSYHREEEMAYSDNSEGQIRFRDVIDYDMWPESLDEW